ncbi:huntingtin-like isoform X3 [Ruditapes philippinarum]|uniref:huntingtin-like isoform X3 n=1 Tax=Ruditapes philippinarum TaxID=129788 RepID=UPI00295B1DB1|nr:huntingtin-like isoform X3 [Ruditapes philippinarum]
MATIEKLIKAFEALRVFQPATSAVEEVVVKKKDQPLNKKDKIQNCNLIADCICASNMRSVSDFPKFLGIAIETFLNLCDDPESDIRMVADECLNKSIKTLLETNLGRLQVELYKEIKKNGSSRCLRAALSRFSEMAHLIRPQKCRPYIVNLLPCVARICRREDEGIQETMLASMMKICPALMVFATDTEVKMLIKAFLPNLSSNLAPCRRAAANCLTLICQYSRNPPTFIEFLLVSLLEIVLPVERELEGRVLVGVIMCIRNVIPLLSGNSLEGQGLKGSFGETKQQKTETVSTEQIITVYQLLVYHLSHSDHNIVNSCLEALQQLLRTPPTSLKTVLTRDGGIKETFIYKKDMKSHTNVLAEVPSTSQLSVTSEDTGLDEESESCDIKSQSGVSDTASSAYSSEINQSESVLHEQSSADSDTVKGSPESVESENDLGVVITCDSDYSNVEIGDIQDDKSEQSVLSNVNTGSRETLLSIKSLSPTHNKIEGRLEIIGQDMNGNPEIVEPEINEPVPAVVTESVENILDKIGSETEGVPLVYCMRVICGRFLLSGKPGELMSDRRVRVSVKSLALGNVASAVKLAPSLFLQKLQKTQGAEASAIIRDIVLYASHPDPQLKGNCSIIIGNLIAAILTEGRGNFDKWVKLHTDKTGDLCLSSLVETLLFITEDSSSVAARLAVSALATCLPKLIHSNHGYLAIKALLKLLQVKNNSYWLVKVEVMDLVKNLDFMVIRHLEHTCGAVKVGHKQFLGPLSLQDHILEEIVLVYIGDEDGRVRKSAANTLVRLVKQLFYPVDYPHQDPIIAVTRNNIDNFLVPTLHDWCQQPPPPVQGLVKPYHVTPRLVVQSNVESVLSRLVLSLMEKLNMAKSKYLIAGCCQALCMLSEVYETSCYPHAWGCAVPVPLLPKETTSKYRRPPTRSLSGSSTFSLDELTSSTGGGPLPLILSLLTSSSVTLDLTTHQMVLQLAGNLVAGSAYRCLKNQDIDHQKSDGQSEEGVWSALSNRLLVPLIDHLLTHVARILNAFAHVIDEQQPGPPQMKTALPSLPTAPSLSPIKRKAKGEKEAASAPNTPSQDAKSTAKPTQKEKEKEAEKERSKKDGLGTFYTVPHYVKFYEVLKGAYSNYKISLDLSVTDKFCAMLKTSLYVLSQVLEVATLSDIGKYAEEFLNYLKSTITLEPTDTVLCVQQLLKALFGTNLCSQWEEHQVQNLPRKQGKTTRLSGNKDGLYQCTFTQPYSQFTQALAAAAIKAVSPDYEDTTGVLTWLKKCVERKVPAILKPSSKADKTAIAAYIRLFEPLVIKALKQYTVTSSLPLQQQVLDLLAQLVQLRVNYCLLDSDQVFIGFVIKQFEYIEEGQIRRSNTLVPNIFNFLVMLSYEKFHSKPVITMPKIIQLCDGIMASGLDPTTHAIPALQPIVHDLFLLRGASKSDISKELETQREVIVSMLLRLIQYHQAIEMFVIVLQQCHRESEERWKRLSRQVTDTVLPALAKQQIDLNGQVALDVVHRLFESVAPIVFRPVDILLKTLLMKPANISNCKGLSRWMCLVLSVLRVLMAQTKEEVVLSRIHELGLKMHVLKTSDIEVTERDRDVVDSLSPEEIMARFFLQIIGLCVSTINQESMQSGSGDGSCDFLSQQLSHLLMYITHMFQSGSFRRVATASVQQTRQRSLLCYYDIKAINQEFLLLGVTQPTLTLQWCNVLILLNFSDQSFWSDVVKTPKKYIMASSSSSVDEKTLEELGDTQQTVQTQRCCNDEILRRGGLILFCDYACENLNDSEHMTWVLINHVRDLIELSEEAPVQDFIGAIHRNSAASSLFIQAIHARWEDVTKPSLVRKTLKCLDAIHFSQSGALLTLLIDKFLCSHHLAVSRACDSIACRRVEMLLAESPQERAKQLPLDDLDKLLIFMKNNKLISKHARLLSLLGKFRESIADDTKSPILAEVSHSLKLPPLTGDLQLDKERYMYLVREQCYAQNGSSRECASLLQHLDYADMLVIMMTKEFNLNVMEECISIGTQRTLHKYSREADIPSTGNQSDEWMLDPLFQASQLTLMRHINNIVNMLPVPHEIVNFCDAKDVHMSKYLEKLEDFFSDSSSLDIVFTLTSSLLQYLVSISVFPWKPKVPAESQNDVCRFCTFCMECVSWLLSNNHIPTAEQLSTSLQCVRKVLQNPQLCSLIGQTDHVTWVCSITKTVYQIVSTLCVLPGQQMCFHVRHEDTPTNSHKDDLHYLTQACDEISELVQYVLNQSSLSGVNHGTTILPNHLYSLICSLVIGLSRTPVLNSFARTPPIVWKMGWIPTPSGEPKTKLPPLPIDLMLDKEVLREFVNRISMIGWISRQQFEETWMCLLGVLNPVSPEQHFSPEEEVERTHCMVYAVRAITNMLVQTMIVPFPGNPTQGQFDIQPRDKPLAFLHTRCGKKLTVIRGVVEHEVLRFSANNRRNTGPAADSVKYMFDSNLERDTCIDDFTLGQVSIESIWSVVGVLESNMSDMSDTTDSIDSPVHQDTPLTNLATSPSETTITRDPSLSAGGLDVHSCLQFLLDLYRQWLIPNSSTKPPLMLLNEVIKSVVCLSDLFAEREQFDWMLDTMFEVYKAHPGEDEISLQYLNVGICKAAAVVGVDNTSADRLIKIIDNGLRSTHIPSKVSSLHGVLYLLEAGIPEVSKPLVPLITEFLLKTLTSVSQQSVCSQKYLLTMWATSFYILENYNTDVKDTDFPTQILQLAISMASSSEEGVSTTVYLAILKGLERLLLTDVLTSQDAEVIVKLSVDRLNYRLFRLCLPSPQRSLAALGLLFTCMYSGKQYDGYSPRPREHETFNMEEPTNLLQDPESLILAMERVTVLFDRIKKGYPYEARVIGRVLPAFLADFFPAQDIMNKVIGEFLSSQQPYPQLIAKVVFQVFSNLHDQRQHGLLRDWVMLSLSNFTQRTPVSMAMWSLTCFFISASTNPWLRNLLSYVLTRMGKIDVIDKHLFCLAGLEFFSQLTDETQRRSFQSTFHTASTNIHDSPYTELLNCLPKS